MALNPKIRFLFSNRRDNPQVVTNAFNLLHNQMGLLFLVENLREKFLVFIDQLCDK